MSWNGTYLLIALYFICIVGLSCLRSFHLSGKTVFLFRAFLPSWRFFEDIGQVPRLYYRMTQNENTLGPWMPCPGQPKRTLRSIFINSEGNLLLACQSLLQQLISDLEEMDGAQTKSVELFVSYQLVKNLVLFQIQKFHPELQNWKYQFKVSEFNLEDSASGVDDVLISPIYEV